jgi:hypothetical protein
LFHVEQIDRHESYSFGWGLQADAAWTKAWNSCLDSGLAS